MNNKLYGYGWAMCKICTLPIYKLVSTYNFVITTS